MNRRLPNEIKATTRQEGTNRLLQKDIVHKIVDNISGKIKRPLGSLEIKSLISHLGKLDGHKFRLMEMEKAVEQISTSYINLISSTSSSIYDTHEIMKQFIGGGVSSSAERFLIKKECGPTSLSGTMDKSSVKIEGYNPDGDGPVYDKGTENDVLTTPVRTQPPVEEQIIGNWVKKNNLIIPREKHIYVLLDTRYGTIDSTSTRYTWNISSQPSDAPNSVCVLQPLRNLIAIQFNQFLIPYTSSGDNIYKKISLLIEDFNISSVIGHESRNYHMMFDTTIVNNRILCIPPIQDDATYRFNEPLNIINKISISFGAPLQPLIFQPSFYPINISFNSVNSTYINFNTPHLVSDGETIIISGFTTISPTTDYTKISLINSETGHIVSVVNNLILEITADITGISTIVNNSPGAVCYITTRRMFIPIRFTYLS